MHQVGSVLVVFFLTWLCNTKHEHEQPPRARLEMLTSAVTFAKTSTANQLHSVSMKRQNFFGHTNKIITHHPGIDLIIFSKEKTRLSYNTTQWQGSRAHQNTQGVLRIDRTLYAAWKQTLAVKKTLKHAHMNNVNVDPHPV